MLSDVSLKLEKREKSSSEYYVYYDDHDGSIKSISSKFKENISYPHIVTSDPDAKQLLLGNLNIKKYVVAELVEGPVFVKKENLIHIQRAEEQLSKIPQVKDVVDSDINIILYHNPGLVEINISNNTMYKLTGNRYNKNNDKKIIGKKNIVEFYLIKHNNPLYLLETIKIDLIDLVNDGYILYDISHLKNKVGLADIGVLTKRIFKTYGLKVKNTYLSTDYHKRKSLKRYFYSKKRNEETNIFTVYKKDNAWFFKSNFEKSDDLKIYNDIKFYVFDKTPNHLIDSFVVPKSEIGNFKIVPLNDLKHNLTKYNLMTDETGKQISINIEDYDE
jgi:hypothetical protein